ncbi:hypothetical protein Pcinc_033289 [Petrolisthes cinctipes]|uniref:Uncharacterized protein n=1 Tax=Petrolisthes cinctipes TaxID=88211 RepID=A0AAE1ESL9_PETCI|nr:hypothetical protein Pcinc_033289 [Petrolisthes cinctipes]
MVEYSLEEKQSVRDGEKGGENEEKDDDQEKVGQGPKHSLGRGVMPALNLAVKHVNEHPTVLRNYKLHVIWNDTEVRNSIDTLQTI